MRPAGHLADCDDVAASIKRVKKARAKARVLAAAKKKASSKRKTSKKVKKKKLTRPKGMTCRRKTVKTKSGRKKRIKVCFKRKSRKKSKKIEEEDVQEEDHDQGAGPSFFIPAPPVAAAPAAVTAAPMAAPAAPAPSTPSPRAPPPRRPLPRRPPLSRPRPIRRRRPTPARCPPPRRTSPSPTPSACCGERASDRPRVRRSSWPRWAWTQRSAPSSTRRAPRSSSVRRRSTTTSNPIAPVDLWGHDHSWWLDRMIRTTHPLVERMTLVWHDWFATSREKVGSATLMLAQNELFRRHALGSFADLLREVTTDPAMLIWLDGVQNSKWDPNENFAREVMELFTLGAGRGAYTEQDVREAARAFTGFRVSWDSNQGYVNFRFDSSRHDTGQKTIFGQTGAWGWRQAIDLCLNHAMHASYFVTKLWSAFVPVPPDSATQAYLQQLYLSNGFQVAPLLEAILKHPTFLRGPSMINPPVVQQAGTLRTLGRHVDTTAWSWLADMAGQRLFFPPNVAGWNEDQWLDTSRWRGRWDTTAVAVWDRIVDPWSETSPYDAAETPEQAVSRAVDWCGSPLLTSELRAALLTFARDTIPAGLPGWAAGPRRGMRQNALRMLILTSSDVQTS